MNESELRVTLVDDKCDVFLSGNTSDLVKCLSTAIKALSIRISDTVSEETHLKPYGLDKQDFREQLTSILIADIMDNLNIIVEGSETQEILPNNTEKLDFSTLETFINKEEEQK